MNGGRDSGDDQLVDAGPSSSARAPPRPASKQKLRERLLHQVGNLIQQRYPQVSEELEKVVDSLVMLEHHEIRRLLSSHDDLAAELVNLLGEPEQTFPAEPEDPSVEWLTNDLEERLRIPLAEAVEHAIHDVSASVGRQLARERADFTAILQLKLMEQHRDTLDTLLHPTDVAAMTLEELEQRESEISTILAQLGDQLTNVRNCIQEKRANQRKCDICMDATKDTVSKSFAKRIAPHDVKRFLSLAALTVTCRPGAIPVLVLQVFNCGHRACAACAARVEECHVCRCRIDHRIHVYD